MRIWDFHGGIHPPENKAISLKAGLQSAGLPEQLILPLQQHAGSPARALVRVGERVVRGQKLAAMQPPFGADLHAPACGTVRAIEARPTGHPSGLPGTCIVIDTEESDDCALLPPLDPFAASPEALLERAREAGLCGLGGAGFPTWLKLSPGNRRVHTLIVNAAECEPYITADDMLMQTRPEAIMGGIRAVLRLLGARRCLIGIEDNKPQAIAALRAELHREYPREQGTALQAGRDIQLLTIPTKYPSGGERQLIRILTGQEVPHGGLPADVGMLCLNVGTLAAYWHALTTGEPLTRRITTLTGNALSRPGNYEVLVGTPLPWLLEKAGLKRDQMTRLVAGGPMMGLTLDSMDVPVQKTSNCFIAAASGELADLQAEQSCIRCGFCADVCPANLLPQQLYFYSQGGQLEQARQYHISDCIECGACAYVCPSHIPLVQYYRHTKGELRARDAETQRSNRARDRFEFKRMRLEREKLEKEARRQARASAAAAQQAARSGPPSTSSASGETQ